MQKDHEEFITLLTCKYGKSKVIQNMLKERAENASYKKNFWYRAIRNYEERLHKLDLMIEEIKRRYATGEKGFLDDDNSTVAELTKFIVN
jgi:23S rRNA A1618 N6-methylase RlmF